MPRTRFESSLWRRRPLWIALVLALAGGGLLAEVFHLARQAALDRITLQAGAAARARALAVESEFARQRAVVAILADDAGVAAALAAPSDGTAAAISGKLDRLHAETESSVLYVLDRTGTAVAASNWREPVSFVGSTYDFREYFQRAMREGTAQQFALGSVSGRPGLYLSHRIGEGLGVAVAKVEFAAIETSWAAEGDPTYVAGPDGHVVLTSRPETRFAPLPPPLRGERPLTVDLPGTGWRLVLYTSTGPATETALMATGTAALGLGLLAVGGARVWRGARAARRRAEAERRYSADLERAVAERTRALSDEMRERKEAERRLAALQADLVQANKLAALGQITAGVAHEINQPLAAIRLLAETGLALQARAGAAGDELATNLGSIVRMVDRIGHITAELRSFSRKATRRTEPVSLAEALATSVLLTASRQRSDRVRMVLPEIDPALRVQADRVRLEQILVNLFQNAEDALQGRAAPEIRVSLTTNDDRIRLTVADNGPGLSPEAMAGLFIPFTTTKPEGLGLGLVIARDIARDFGGSLGADAPEPGQGARFHLDLRIAA